jgi:hypothetical protein
MELRLILGKKPVKSFSNKPGFTIAIAETAAIGIIRYKLLIAKSDLPSTKLIVNTARVIKRQAYGIALVRADTNWIDNFCIFISNC